MYYIRVTSSGRYWIKKLLVITGFFKRTCLGLKLCSLDRLQLLSLFIHSQTKVLSTSEFHCPRPVTLATNTLFPIDTKSGLKKTPFRLKSPRVERKTAITGRRGEKLNTGKLLPKISVRHNKMILSFLSLLKYLSLAPGTIGSCVLCCSHFFSMPSYISFFSSYRTELSELSWRPAGRSSMWLG